MSFTHKRLNHNIQYNSYQGRQITNIKTRYQTTFTWWQAKEEELTQYEEKHQIETRWWEDLQQYKDALTLPSEHEYRRSVDNLERLVIQHLLELTKLRINGVSKPAILPRH